MNLNSASTHYLDATVAFLVTASKKISESDVTEKSIRLNAFEYILEWIESAMQKINANFITEVARTRSSERKYLVDSCLRPYVRRIVVSANWRPTQLRYLIGPPSQGPHIPTNSNSQNDFFEFLLNPVDNENFMPFQTSK